MRFRPGSIAGIATALALLPATGAAAAPFTVDSTGDGGDETPGDGVCATPPNGPGVCTLRAAVQETNALAGDDTITLPAGLYQLTGAAGEDSAATGDLDIADFGSPTSGSLTILGAGARTTRVVGTGADRVFEGKNSGMTVSISGVTVTGGGGVQQGGGISMVGTFNLTDVAVVGNRADDPAGFSNQGGGIFNNNRMNLTNVTVSGNTAARGVSSTFGPQGGGIFDNGDPGSTLTNVTISGNQATGAGSQGGGFFYNAGVLSTTLRNVTIAGNTVPAGEQAGGFFVNGSVTFANTIVALNRSGGVASNCLDNGTVDVQSSGGNLEEGTDCFFTAAGDLRNSDPRLGPLADNGGQTDTRALLTGSPALDAARACPPPATDQRGLARPQGAGCDIGAFELAGGVPPTPPGPPALPPPVLGRTVNVEPVSGRVFVSVPAGAARIAQSVPGLKGRRFVPLSQARQIPVRSLLDTRKGTVRITSARDSRGATQAGRFSSGVFQILQSRSPAAKGLTDLVLKGSGFGRCKSAKRSVVSTALSKRKIRRLRSDARGRFRTRGRHSAATVRGTVWTVTDRCDGTLTQVRRGRVTVRDFRRKKNITLRAGKSYLARAGRR